MNKVSIIIPIYNAENYIEKCLKSIINQSYKEIEIICIDNNSNDSSIKIAEKYAEIDSRIKIEKEKRKGVSYARNKGIDIATGDFISFIDSDDFVEQNFIEKLLCGVQDKGDISIGNFYIVNNNLMREKKETNQRVYLDKESIIERIFLRNEFCAFCWNKLYKTKIIKENNLTFLVNQNICEDLLFNLNYVKNSKDGGWYDFTPIYNYVQHSNSSYNTLNIENWSNVFELEKYVENLDILRTEKQITNWKFYYLYMLLDYRERCYLAKKKSKENEVLKKVKTIKKEVFKNNSIGFLLKTKIMIKIYIPKASIEVKKYRRKINER